MKTNKEPSLLRKIIEIHYEQAKRRKALRILNSQIWSTEFLEYLVCHAAKKLGKDIVITVTSPKGQKIEIKSVKGYKESLNADNDIFNNIDNAMAVESFIAENSVR